MNNMLIFWLGHYHQVKCSTPITLDEDDYEDDFEDDDDDFEDNFKLETNEGDNINNSTMENPGDGFGLRGASLDGGFTQNANAQICSGSLVLYYAPETNLADIGEVLLKGSSYRNLRWRLLKNGHFILKIRVEGSCCWKMYKRRNFKGDVQSLEAGEEYDQGRFQFFQPHSVMKSPTCKQQ